MAQPETVNIAPAWVRPGCPASFGVQSRKADEAVLTGGAVGELSPPAPEGPVRHIRTENILYLVVSMGKLSPVRPSLALKPLLVCRSSRMGPAVVPAAWKRSLLLKAVFATLNDTPLRLEGGASADHTCQLMSV